VSTYIHTVNIFTPQRKNMLELKEKKEKKEEIKNKE
jgi:hypothetical protein